MHFDPCVAAGDHIEGCIYGGVPRRGKEATVKINIVFDGPPGPEPGRVVEVEDTDGDSVRIGIWMKYPKGQMEFGSKTKSWWVLQLEVPDEEVRR